MTTKTIPLGAVRVALTGAVVKSRTSEPRARTAAFTRQTLLARCCGSHIAHVDAEPVHFGVMEAGELPRLIKRVQLEYGSTEVRKVWGQGVKALLADVGSGVMR